MVDRPSIVEELRRAEDSGVLKTEDFNKNVNRDFFRLAVDNSLDSVFIIDYEKMCFIDVNKTACNSTGYSRDELLSIGPQDIKPEFTKRQLRDKFDEVLKSNSKGVIETVHLRKDGSRFPVEVFLSCLKDENVIIASVRDISERIKNKEKLAETEKEYKLLIESLNEGVWKIDKNSITTFVNKSMAKMLGYTVDEMIGKHLFSFMDEKGKKIAEENLKRREQGIDEQHDFEFIRKDGRRIYATLETSSIINENDEYEGAIAGVIDITARKENEEIIKKRVNYEKTLQKISKVFLNESDVDTAVDRSLKLLLSLSKVSRVYFFKNFFDSEDGLCMKQIYEVCAKGVPPEIDNPDLQHVSYNPLFKRWYDNLSKDKPLYGPIKDFPESEREILEPQGIKSILVIPVFVNSKFYGFIGFDDISSEKYWDNEDIYLLQTVAESIGSFLGRKQAQETLLENEKRFRSLTENVLGAIYRCRLDSKWTMKFISSHIEDISGYPASDFIDNKVRSFADIIYPDDRSMVEETISQAANKKRHFSMEYRIIDSKGDIRWVFEKGQAIFDENDYIKWLDGSIFDITKRKKAEEKIKESERELRDFFDNANDLIQSVRPDGSFNYVNKKWKEVMGYFEDEIKNLHFTDILREDHVSHCSEIFKELSKGKSFDNIEVVFKTKDGKEVFVNGNLNSRLVDGKFVLTRGIFRDVTENKKNERKLAEAKNIINISPVVAFTWKNSEGWPVEYVSKNVENLFGYSSKDFLSGKILFEKCIHPDDIKRVSSEVKNSIENNKKRFEHKPYRIITKDGSIRYVLDRSYVIKNDNGNVTHFKGIIEDVTEKQKMMNEIVEAKNKYSTLVEQSTDGIMIVQDQIFKFANKALSKITGFSVDELEGMDFLDAVANLEKEKLADRYKKRMQGKEVPNYYETKILCKNGEEKPVELSANLIEYHKKPAILAIIRDISERKEIERKLTQSEKLFRTLIEHSTVGVYIHDPLEHKMIYANPLIKEILGLKEVETKNIDFFEYLHPDDENLIKNRLKRRFAGQKVDPSIEIRIFTKDKKMRWVKLFTTLIEYEGKKVALASAVDITQTKEASDRIHQSEERFRVLFDSSTDAIFIYDPNDFSIIDVNKEACRRYGFSYEEMKKLNIDDISDESMISFKSKESKKYIQKLIDGETITMEWLSKDKKGKKIWHEMKSKLVEIDGKKRILATARDINKRKKAEEKLSKQVKRINLLNDIISEGVKTKDLSSFFKKTIGNIINNLDYSAGGVYIVDDNNKTASLLYSKNISDKMAGKISDLDVNQPPYNKVFKNKEIFTINDYDKIRPELGKICNFKSVISVPIISSDEVVGALNFAKSKKENFGSSEKELLKAIAFEMGNVVKLIKYEEELKKKMGETDRILNAAGDGIRIIGKDFKVINMNQTMAQLSGVDKDNGVGINCQRMFGAKGICGTEKCSMVKVLKNKKGFQTQNIRETIDGKKVPCLHLVTPYFDNGGEIVGIIEDFRDISEIKEKELELKEKIDELKRWKKVTVGREHKMRELKEKIKELKKQN